MRLRTPLLAAALLAAGILLGSAAPDRLVPTSKAQEKQAGADPLPSWNDGPAKKAILDFVARVTKEGGPDFVPVAERIATFDNDGTLWSEQPIYFQVEFAMARVKALADKHPEWKDKQPFKAALEGDVKALASEGERRWVELITATHAGMTTEEFEEIVKDWLATARHPRFKRPYTDLVYQPMLELLAYLRANGFKTYVVSGGGIEFMRPWTEKVYGIPPEQVVGTSIKTKFELRDGKPVLLRLPEIDFIDDKAGKPVGIGKFIGRRPIMAFGNSDGDLEMLQWTTMTKGPRFGLIVHHTDAEREWAYDRDSFVGRLDKALDDAPKQGWVVVDMKKEWKVIYPFEK
jgi:phosphoglycolate phosphatase-like HAD superfamily hydrolase